MLCLAPSLKAERSRLSFILSPQHFHEVLLKDQNRSMGKKVEHVVLILFPMYNFKVVIKQSQCNTDASV